MINLIHFHSPITKQKLSLIKPAAPIIPYSTYDEINSKFKEFSSKKQAKTEMDEAKIDQKLGKKNLSLPRRASMTPNFQRKIPQRMSVKLDDETFKKSLGESENLGQIVKEEYEKNKESFLHGEINPVVKFFGNTLIGSVFQALMIKCVEEVCSLKQDETDAMSSKYLLTKFL